MSDDLILSDGDLGRLSLSAEQAGRICGMSGRRMRDLGGEGRVPRLANGRFRAVEAVPAYCSINRPAAGRAAAGGAEAAGALDEARVRLLTAQAEAREMLNEQMRGDAVLVEDMEAAVGALVASTRAKLLALPAKLGPVLAPIADPMEVMGRLRAALYEALAEMAAGPAAESVMHRARERAGHVVADAGEVSAS